MSFSVGDKPFRALPVPVEDLKEFYRIDRSMMPADRPYAWSIYVMSLTGIVTYLDYSYPDRKAGLTGSGVALSHMKDKWREAEGSEADAKCLKFGWSEADAIVTSASNVRAKLGSGYEVEFDDLKKYRAEELGKDAAPLRVVLTKDGFNAEELKYPIFNQSDRRTLIVTSTRGYEAMEREAQKLPPECEPMKLSRFEVLGDEEVDVGELMRLLRSKYGVMLADLSGGPHLSNQFFLSKLVDEYRLTVSPVFINSLNDEGKQRLTPLAGKGFGPSNSPTGPVIGRRYYKDYTFIRTAVNYHH